MPILGMTMELPEQVGWSVLRRGDDALLRSVRPICHFHSLAELVVLLKIH